LTEVVLLGTGAAAGWPCAFCRCASCEWARAAGETRAHASALVDGTVLLDCGPDVPHAAGRHGFALDRVRLLLLTHAHVDHAAPEGVLWRHYAGLPEPLLVAGPANAVARYEQWIDPAGPVTLHVVRAGETVIVDGYAATALPANHGDAMTGDCLLWDLTTPDGFRLLYAADTGPLPDVPDGPYDLVLLEETHGDWRGHRGDHLDLASFGATVAALRRSGAVRDTTRVVATHLGDHNPPGPELARRLALYGAELHPDGARLSGPPAPRVAPPRRTLVLGGARSGKSVEAERRLAAEPEVVYVATSLPRDDPEWNERVAAHRARRPEHWRTVETTDLVPLLREDGPPLLVECLTLWLASGEADVDGLLAAWRQTPRRVVAVSNEVGSGVVPATASGRAFRDDLGRLNAAVAAASDEVWLTVAGVARRLR
jgi:adenosylcobinamide kinase/adenosylcobinamide-phosphate guanylyltransferase